ncbi:MAG TPA: hypothetical protein VLA84_00095 [Microcoleus sp.]|nr:hypothetical protein [Microcoleus sp.]
MTQKVKLPQQAVMKQLENHPEIVYIHGAHLIFVKILILAPDF